MNSADARFIELFLNSFSTVFSTLFQEEMTRTSMSVWNRRKSENDIAVITGVTGKEHTGMIIYSMQRETARHMIQTLMPDTSDFEDMIFDGLGELVNIISGNSMTAFSDNNLDVSITAPSLIAGDQFEMHMLNQSTLSADMQSDMGSIEVKFAIKKI